MSKEIDIKITNAKQLVKVLKDIQTRAYNKFTYGNYSTREDEAYQSYKDSIATLIKVLEEAE